MSAKAMFRVGNEWMDLDRWLDRYYKGQMPDVAIPQGSDEEGLVEFFLQELEDSKGG